MKVKRFPLVLAATTLVVIGGQVQAASIWIQLTPDTIGKQDRTFTVKIQGDGKQQRVEVRVKAKGRKLSPFIRGNLTIADEDTDIAACDLNKTERDGEIIYSFYVSSKYLKKSKFTFEETVCVEKKDEQGKTKLVAMPSADF